MEQEKRCENCKYFLVHYIKGKISFNKLFEGHCTNGEIPWKIRKNDIQDKHCCEKWESNEFVKTKRKESIIRVITDMRSTLLKIEELLSDES